MKNNSRQEIFKIIKLLKSFFKGILALDGIILGFGLSSIDKTNWSKDFYLLLVIILLFIATIFWIIAERLTIDKLESEVKRQSEKKSRLKKLIDDKNEEISQLELKINNQIHILELILEHDITGDAGRIIDNQKRIGDI